MSTWILVGVILGTFFVQVYGFLGKVFKGVGRIVGSVVKPVFGIDKFEQQARHGRHSVESGIATFNDNIASSLRNLDAYVKNDIVPEVKKTLDTARDAMVGIAESTQQVADSTTRLLDTTTDVLVPETVLTLNTSRWMMIQFMNVTMGMQDRIGQSLDNVDYLLELFIALVFMALGVVCGYELRNVGRVLRPRGLKAFEINLLKWSRIVCFVFALLLVFHIILRVLHISIVSKIEKRNFFFLIPVLFVASYYAISFRVKIFRLLCIGSNYILLGLKYFFYLPYIVFYYVFLAPFVLTYRCFIDRHHHASRIPTWVIYIMPVFFCAFYSGLEDILKAYLNETENENDPATYSLTWLYSLIISYVLFHFMAVTLRFCYPPFVPPVVQQVVPPAVERDVNYEVNCRPPIKQRRL